MNQYLSGPFLELLNGSAITPETIWLVLLAIYLRREAHRRGLRSYQWFRLPANMDLILALFICDVGVQVRSLTVWWWRRFDGAGAFSEAQTVLLMLSGALIVVGYLCKIRALTFPDYGRGPWLRAALMSGAALVGLLLFR